MLTLAGGLIGLAVGIGLASAIAALAPEDVPRLGDIAINPIVVTFTFLVVAVTALLCGLDARCATRAAAPLDGGAQ